MTEGNPKKVLNVLVVEGSETDEELLLLELKRAGYVVNLRCVQTEEAIRQAFAEGSWDIVISDSSLPQFDALGALAVKNETGLDIPFVIISGTIGEDTAVTALHAGATDFLVKGRLSRLRTAIDR